MKFLSVDRIEENHLVCEDENMNVYIVEFKTLSPNLKEGCIIEVDDNGKITVNELKTNIRKSEIINLREELDSKN